MMNSSVEPRAARVANRWLRLMRMDRPIGIYLLLWPTLWALWFAGSGKPSIGRSILPFTTLTGRLEALRHIDSQPLGAVLFNDPSMSREPVAASYMTAADLHVPKSICNQMTHLWGRRSVFRLDSKPLLVSEIFLPSFQDDNHGLEE